MKRIIKFFKELLGFQTTQTEEIPAIENVQEPAAPACSSEPEICCSPAVEICAPVVEEFEIEAIPEPAPTVSKSRKKASKKQAPKAPARKTAKRKKK